MMRRTLPLLAGALLAVALSAAPVPAEDTLPKVQPPAGAPAAPTDDRLTPATLETMLRQMGLDPKLSKSSDGTRTFFHVVVNTDTFRFVLDISLDPDGGRLWFLAPLKQVDDISKVPADRLWALLQDNDSIYPASFSYYKAQKRLYLTLVLDNHGITAGRLHSELLNFMRIIERTYPHWNTAEWPGGAPTAGNPPTPPSTPPAAPPTPGTPPVFPPAAPPIGGPGKN
jgi:hypothetical protein